MAGVVVVGNTLIPIPHSHRRRRTLIPSQSQRFQSQFQFQSQFPSLRIFNLRPASIIIMSATANTAPIQHNATLSTTTTTTTDCWSEFARNVSGEWDGFGADFTLDGKPIELPENVVPNAYRDWEVQVFDWQTQCPTLAQPDTSSALYKLIKLLPTVGCEADAATRWTIDERIIGGPDNMVSAFAYQSNGCYTAVWSTQKPGSSTVVLELEHCLIDPRDKESRVRIVQVMGVDDKTKLALKNVKVFVEQWYGPFRNGDQLGGCAIRDSAFAKTQALAGSQVSGVWQSTNSKASFQDSTNKSFLQQLIKVDGIEKLVRNEEHLLLLPKNLWSSVKETKDGEETWCEVGWALEAGRNITSKCIFSRNAELKEIITSSETLGV